jgi:tetratricopeptide (TPR) repeat protein
VCNQAYPDELPACPHCAEAKKTHLAGGPAEDRKTQLAGGGAEDRKTQLADINPADLAEEPAASDSAVNLGQPAAGASEASGPPSNPPSDSGIDWTAIGEEPQAAPSEAVQATHEVDVPAVEAPAEVEAVVDEEIAAELSAEDAVAPALSPTTAEGEGIDFTMPEPEPVGPVSDSAVDLGASVPELVEEGSGAAEEKAPRSGSEVFMAELASDASRVDLVGGSGVNLVEEEVIEVAEGSGVTSAEKVESEADHDLIVEAVEAGIDESTPAAELTEEAALDASLVEEPSSAVDLGAEPLSEEPVSAVEAVEAVAEEDVIEAVDESGINLGSGHDLTSSAKDESNLVLESLLSESPSGARPAEEEAAIVEEAAAADEETVAVEAEVDDLLANLEHETAAGESALAEDAVSAEDAGSIAGEEAAFAGEETVAAEGEPAAVSESEVDDLLASLDQEPAAVEEGEPAAAVDEEVVGEAAEEEVVASAEEDEEKPPKPVKQRSRVPALMGGTFLGLLLGAGGLIGARFAGVDVPEMIGVSEKKPSGPTVPQVKVPTFQERAALVRRGDFDDAAKAGIEQIQESNPEELAERGSYRLGAYLQKSGAKVNLQDPPLQQAIADLQKAAEAKNLDAIYDLGLINELANKLPEARAEYTKGVAAAGNDPVQKRRFESALDRVELKTSGNPVPAALLLPERVEDRAALLALLLIGLQQPAPQPAPQAPQPAPQQPAGGGEEAGFDFWQAAKLARAGEMDKAIETIRKARTLHDTRRFARLRKAQNPFSDPTEEIFLRCCTDLEQYWMLQKQLRPKYLTNKNTPVQAVQSLLKEAGDNAATVEKITNKLVEEKVIKVGEDPSAGVEGLIAEKKKADTKVADLMTDLKKAEDEAKKEAAKAAAKLKMIEEDRDTKLKAADAREKQLKTDNDDLNSTLKKIADDLAMAKYLDPKGKADVPEAVRKVLDVARMKDPAGTIRQQRSDIARLTASLKERWRPEEMMSFWRLLLEQNRSRAELSGQARMDVQRVKADQAATPAQKGQADVVLGLALRNDEKFAEAKTVLETARSAVDMGDWLVSANAALKEVSDPASYFAAQAQRLYDTGQMDAALAVLDHAMKVLAEKDQARLFAQKSLIELDAARSKARGPLPAKDPLVVAAQKDAAAAVNAGLAEGHYAAGRIAEELGQFAAAIESYRKAVAAHPALDADGSRYRVSLARVLLQPHEARPGQPAAPTGEKVGWRDPAPYPARTWQEMRVFTLMVVLGLQAPPLPGEEPNLEEAEKLADEILKAPANTVPFNVRAQALAIKGRWTLALQTYVAGIRPFMPREYGNGLEHLVLNHPRLKRPDSLRTPNPFEAERHFAAGLNFYFDRDYSKAEKEFLLTVENDSHDARYFYFLGLSRLGQNKRPDAYADFEEGATLERQNRPSSAAVSESLERIQGPLRRIVNEVRTRPLER